MGKWELIELQRCSGDWGRVVDEILRIEKRVFPKHESLSRSFDGELRKRNCNLVYAQIGDEIAGYAMYSSPSSLCATIKNSQFVMIVNDMYGWIVDTWNSNVIKVKESYQGQGMGEALARYAIEKCRMRNIHRVSLHVDPTRLPTMNLYKKLGFEVDTLVQGYYSSNRDAYRMYLDLTSADSI